MMTAQESARQYPAGTIMREIFRDVHSGVITFTRIKATGYTPEGKEKKLIKNQYFDLSKDSVDTIVTYAVNSDAKGAWNAHFSPCIAARIPDRELERENANTRLKTEDVAIVPCFFLDCDTLLDPDKAGKKVPATLEDAQTALDNLSVPPTITVCSGCGVHAYWIFKKPLPVRNTNKLTAVFAAFRKGLAWQLGEEFSDVDYKATEPDHIFRIDGTHNHKRDSYDHKPEPVYILSYTDRRYTIDDLKPVYEDFLQAANQDTSKFPLFKAGSVIPNPNRQRAYLCSPAGYSSKPISAADIAERISIATHRFKVNDDTPEGRKNSSPVKLFRRFYLGDVQTYDRGDDSSADFALMLQLWGLLDGDMDAVKEAFVMSKLYRPERGEVYLERTLAKVQQEAINRGLIPIKWHEGYCDRQEVINA